jgi:apolipoprotein D and lipocalin family protein
MNAILKSLCATAMTGSMLACSATVPLETVEQVDLPRFMGDWYVIANIPTRIERGAHNAVESYRLDSDGSIATTFTFRKDGFDGKQKQYNPRGFVWNDKTNAEWGMQFVWPIKADYRIVYLDADYQTTIIGRNKRDYVWLMARSPEMSEQRYAELIEMIANMGYDTDLVERVPQQW